MAKEQEVVRIEDQGAGRRFSLRRFVVFLFILISLSLLVYAFYDDFPNITGGVISGITGSDKDNSTSLFEIRAELNELSSYLDIDQEIGKISIDLKKSEGSIYFGKEGALNLSGLDKTHIEIEGFDGVIVFDKEKIYNLNGNAFKLKVDEIATSSPNSEVKISITNELNYESLSLDSVNIKKYESSMDKGKVIIDDGRVSLNLNDESFSVQRFIGRIESGLVGNFGIKRKGIIFDGTAEGVAVGGKFKIDVNS